MEILEVAIKSLSKLTNLGSGLNHPLDKSRAQELFKALYKEGIPLNYSEVRSLAIKYNWPTDHAEKLAKLAEKIGAGGRVVIKHPSGWGERIVEQIKAQH